ncbi:MAG: hypothetical protein NC217_05925 [Muribaculaceae bacterium]|nr:hypothetical protein [Muribaculaceae bacterium]
MNEQELTPWQIWLHPRRAHTLIEQLNADLQQTSEALAKSQQECHEQIEELKKTRSALQAENTELSLRLKRLNEEYDEQEADIAEIKSMFDQVEAMKARYDKRMEKYKAKIADLERALARMKNVGANDIMPLPPLPKREAPKTKPAKLAPPPNDIEPDSDWYHPLDL